jgi:arylsulfatase A-like enzyme
VLTGKSKALIPESRTTVASLLKKSGYHTAFIGKWHLGWNWAEKDTANFGGEGWNYEDFDNLDFTQNISHSPNDLGFDYTYGHSGSLDMAPYVYVENGRITATVDSVTEDTGKYTWWRKGPTASDFVHEDVTPNFFRRTIAHIKKRSEQDAPFFLYLALPSPHTPILPTPEWQGKSGINSYADFMMQVDDYVGQVMETVRAQGIEENTIIIFTSDHGEGAGRHMNVQKWYPFEEAASVPFIVCCPERIRKNIVDTETLVSGIDIVPTICDFAGVDPPKDCCGKSLKAVL